MKIGISHLIPELKRMKNAGRNIQQYLESCGFSQGTIDVIEASYDLQAGDDYDIYCKNEEFYDKFIKEIFHAICYYVNEDINSLLDCGTGEGTTLIPFLRNWERLALELPDKICACDISSKRLEVMSSKFDVSKINIVKTDIRELPFLGNSFDFVTTFHSIEPNFFDSERILKEVIRVSKKYILLVEPVYEYASQEQKERMDEFKYFRGLPEFLKNHSGVKILTEHEMVNNFNEKNKGHLFLLEKQ